MVAFDGLPIVRFMLLDGGGVAVGVGLGVGVGVGDAKLVIVIASQLILFVPPETFLNSNRTADELLTVNVAVVRLVELVVTVDPTCVHVEPLFVDFQSCHVLVPSVPYFACWIETVPALATLKFMLTLPEFRTRAENEPTLRSLVVLPVKASSMNHEPVPSVTFAAAYAVLPPASKPSVSSVAADEPTVINAKAANIATANEPRYIV